MKIEREMAYVFTGQMITVFTMSFVDFLTRKYHSATLMGIVENPTVDSSTQSKPKTNTRKVQHLDLLFYTTEGLKTIHSREDILEELREAKV